MADFPRFDNGYVDNGTRIGRQLCPNCSSSKYICTVSLEKCSNCGLFCDYWGTGGNSKYQSLIDRNESFRDELPGEYKD